MLDQSDVQTSRVPSDDVRISISPEPSNSPREPNVPPWSSQNLRIHNPWENGRRNSEDPIRLPSDYYFRENGRRNSEDPIRLPSDYYFRENGRRNSEDSFDIQGFCFDPSVDYFRYEMQESRRQLFEFLSLASPRQFRTRGRPAPQNERLLLNSENRWFKIQEARRQKRENQRISEVSSLALSRQRHTRRARYDGLYRIFSEMNVDPPASPADQRENGRMNHEVSVPQALPRLRPTVAVVSSGGRYSEQVRPEVLNTPASRTGQNLAVIGELALTIPEDFLHQAAYFSEQLRPEVLNTPASQTGLNLAVMRELALMIPEDFLRQILRRLRQTYRREHFGMNVEVPGNLQASQTYQRPQGEWYTVIGLIFTISCGIYGILLVLTEQMYKEEDGSFFSHHGVMVTISVLAMVYAAFSGVFLGVVYNLATADPANAYRKRMRFLWGSFVYAACFGPAVMFMAMFVQPLGLKVFAWAVLSAALTRVGLYIRY